MARWMLLSLLLACGIYALSVEETYHSQGDPVLGSLAFYDDPEKEPLDSVRIQIRLRPEWRYGSVTLMWNNEGPWARKRPVLSRDGEELVIHARRFTAVTGPAASSRSLVAGVSVEAWRPDAEEAEGASFWESVDYQSYPVENDVVTLAGSNGGKRTPPGYEPYIMVVKRGRGPALAGRPERDQWFTLRGRRLPARAP